MLCEGVGLLLRGGEDAAQGGDVLVVPCVAVGDARAFGDASDLIAVVPPGHHPRVLWRVVAKPMVGLAVVVEDDLLAILQPRLEHDLRLGGALSELHRVVVKLSRVLGADEEGEQAEAEAWPDRLGAVHLLLEDIDCLGEVVSQLLEVLAGARTILLTLAERGLALAGRLGLGRRRLRFLFLLLTSLVVSVLLALRLITEGLDERRDEEIVPRRADGDSAEGSGDGAEEDNKAGHL
mmetsp:Transcript_27728/g.55788  ORF Transcript_27728/g.55788 Transcript_27728/m.55788 type:complete len:236 (-) Transcript_27728:1301-2008(-)